MAEGFGSIALHRWWVPLRPRGRWALLEAVWCNRQSLSMYSEGFTPWEPAFEHASKHACIFGVIFKNHHTHTRHAHSHSCIYFNDYTFIWMHVVCLFRSVCVSIKAGAEWGCMVWVWSTKIRMLMHMHRRRSSAELNHTSHLVCPYCNVHSFQPEV